MAAHAYFALDAGAAPPDTASVGSALEPAFCRSVNMDQTSRAAAREYLIRYGGDTFPNSFKSAKGTVVRDDTGREILDFTSGQMCATIG
ncbi:hypothetical protein OY671_011850, partial [Metschnikowia pulcherrima]